LREVFAVHNRALRPRGLPGIRDQGSIEAAIARPYTGYYRSIASKAAALTHSLALNHGFIDGNKRTALLMVDLFLRKSGYALRHRSRRQLNYAMETMILDVVTHRLDFNQLVDWFHQRLVRVE
jgi:death-on-curing protein